MILLDHDAYYYKAIDLAVRGVSYNGVTIAGHRRYILNIYISSLAFEYMGIEKLRIVWGGLVTTESLALWGINA